MRIESFVKGRIEQMNTTYVESIECRDLSGNLTKNTSGKIGPAGTFVYVCFANPIEFTADRVLDIYEFDPSSPIKSARVNIIALGPHKGSAKLLGQLM